MTVEQQFIPALAIASAVSGNALAEVGIEMTEQTFNKFDIMKCIYCDTQLPEKGYFCPNCFKQIKCKHCSEELLKEAKICVFCGEEIGQKIPSSNLNKIEFSETDTERSFKASFTDTVGQSISESFGMILSNKIGYRNSLPPAIQNSNYSEQYSSSISTTNEIIDDVQRNINIEPKVVNLPSLKDVKLRDLAKTEIDWLLVFAYNASDGGEKEFTRTDILNLYREIGRYDVNKSKGISQYFKNASKAQYIKSTSNTHYILLEKGKIKALEIFNGTSTSKTVKRNTSKGSSTSKDDVNNQGQTKSKRAKVNSTVAFIDLKLTHSEQKSLNDFFETKKPMTQNENVIVAMKWYIDHKKIEEVSMEELNYLLSIASKTPPALAQVLGNMVGSGFRWVTKGTIGKYQLSSIGESYIMNKLPKVTK